MSIKFEEYNAPAHFRGAAETVINKQTLRCELSVWLKRIQVRLKIKRILMI